MTKTKTDKIPFLLSDLKITICLKVNQVNKPKFLGDVLDENLNWESHIKLILNKVPKNIDYSKQALYIISKMSVGALPFLNSFLHYLC